MDINNLVNEIRTKPLFKIVHEFMFEGNPICFKGDKIVINDLKYELGKGFFIHPKAIEIVGSAKLGFSLNPNKLGKKFNKYSDIDIVIISEQLFDRAWHEILKKDLYDYYDLTEKDGLLISECYKNISEGFIRPDKLPTSLQFSRKWWAIFSQLSKSKNYEHRKIRGRLFKDWLFAEKYYAKSLVDLIKGVKDGN